jgi:MFS family permease
MIPDLVPPSDLMNALSLNSATYNGAALIGPAMAGALLQPLGAGTLFALNAVSFLAVIFALVAMKGVRTLSGGARQSFATAATQGLMFALHNRLILVLLLLSAITSFFGRSYQALLPAFARDIFSSGSEGYGILLSAAGAGALIGAFGLAWVREIKRQGAVMIASGFLFGLTLIGFTLSRSLAVGATLLLVAGAASTVFGTINATFIQLLTPNELRGRVMSLYAVTLIGVPSLGALMSGALAEALGGLQGSPRAVLIGAVIVIGVLVLVVPSFWTRDAVRPVQA